MLLRYLIFKLKWKFYYRVYNLRKKERRTNASASTSTVIIRPYDDEDFFSTIPSRLLWHWQLAHTLFLTVYPHSAKWEGWSGGTQIMYRLPWRTGTYEYLKEKYARHILEFKDVLHRNNSWNENTTELGAVLGASVFAWTVKHSHEPMNL